MLACVYENWAEVKESTGRKETETQARSGQLRVRAPSSLNSSPSSRSEEAEL